MLVRPGSSCPVLCLGGGTPHKPAVLSGTGHVIHEASAYAAYLAKKAGEHCLPSSLSVILHECLVACPSCNGHSLVTCSM